MESRKMQDSQRTLGLAVLASVLGVFGVALHVVQVQTLARTTVAVAGHGMG